MTSTVYRRWRGLLVRSCSERWTRYSGSARRRGCKNADGRLWCLNVQPNGFLCLTKTGQLALDALWFVGASPL
jgi:hypothetical protein